MTVLIASDGKAQSVPRLKVIPQTGGQAGYDLDSNFGADESPLPALTESLEGSPDNSLDDEVLVFEPLEPPLQDPVNEAAGATPGAEAAQSFPLDRPAVTAEALDQTTIAGPAVWTSGGMPSAAAKALIDVLAEAPSHGLPASRYGRAALARDAEALAGGDASRAAAFEAAMTRAFLAYARDITSGVVTPSEVDSNIKIKVQRPEREALLAGLARASDPRAFLAGLAPAEPEYARLRSHLAAMTEIARNGGWGATVPEGRTLRPGDRGDAVAALRQRLVAMGDLGAAAAEGSDAVMAINSVASDARTVLALSEPGVFDDALLAAVKSFQTRHGLNADGVVGPATLAALNVSAAERARAIAVNMERLRWFNRDIGAKRVMVNLAGFSMVLIENGREVFRSRVVVGQPKHQTPEFSDEIEHMVVNPYWNVPSSIAVNEILPKLRQDPTYLARNNMEIEGVDPWFINWYDVTPRNFPGRIKQRPGADNALGQVKFLFPNDNAVYLHDTPSRNLFAKDMRAFSHGCVRVEKPVEFAHILLAAQTSDPAATYDRLRASGKERWVNLEEHIPVHLVYRTAWIDADGIEQYRSDIYGRDEAVMAALAAAGVALEI